MSFGAAGNTAVQRPTPYTKTPYSHGFDSATTAHTFNSPVIASRACPRQFLKVLMAINGARSPEMPLYATPHGNHPPGTLARARSSWAGQPMGAVSVNSLGLRTKSP